MLLATITDGKQICQMLELSRSSSLSVDTIPGTKILIKDNLRITEGFIEMNDKNITILGGEVDKLVERWLVERDSTSSEFRVR
jgi:hypothetical protein